MISDFAERLDELPRRLKRLVLLANDTLLVPFCFLLAFALRTESLVPPQGEAALFLPLLAGLGALGSILVGLPKMKLSAFEHHGILRALFFAALMTGVAVLAGAVLSLPLGVALIFGLFLFIGTTLSRILGLLLMNWMAAYGASRTPVAIYGAGSAGIQLAAALRSSRDYAPIFFVDDNTSMQGITVAGLPVHPPAALAPMARTGRIDRVLLAMPSVGRNRRKELTTALSTLPCEVQALPSFDEMITSGNILDSLRPVSPQDLLGREAVALDLPEVNAAYSKKSLMITGAGGSIGSELARQALNCRAARLVLFEQSEHALYQIERELRPLALQAGTELVPILGSVCDRKRVRQTMIHQGVDIVLHAAAYKHVPMVETNELEGLQNNILGTRIVAEEAGAAAIERFILISTDKAVRPTNVMGATKRMAELVVQDLAARSRGTLFSMVRFGNVLGSSGSVIPLFQEQIKNGGPVTLTHDNVTRYFMTIPEAARLVLLAGSYATGGDVFVLDMGEPVRIYDLARRMIELSGLSLRDAKNPTGDIEIRTTGLRPGEKLYEELLIDDTQLATPHDKIFRAQEAMLTRPELIDAIRDVERAVDTNDRVAARRTLLRWVEGYAPARGGDKTPPREALAAKAPKPAALPAPSGELATGTA